MKRIGLISGLLLLSAVAGLTQVQKHPFTVGERLDYSLWFNFIKGGRAVMKVVTTESLAGFNVYRLSLESESSPFFDRIFRVRDYMSSWIDVKGLYSYRFQKDISEGKYRKRYAVRFDYQQQRAYSENDTLTIRNKVQDPLSVIYRVRAENLHVGKVLSLNYFDNNRLREYNITVDRMEKIEVPAGNFYCFVLEPAPKDGKPLKYHAEMTIYLAADTTRLPVLITTDAAFGKMIFKLERYQRSGGD